MAHGIINWHFQTLTITRYATLSWVGGRRADPLIALAKEVFHCFILWTEEQMVNPRTNGQQQVAEIMQPNSSCKYLASLTHFMKISSPHLPEPAALENRFGKSLPLFSCLLSPKNLHCKVPMGTHTFLCQVFASKLISCYRQTPKYLPPESFSTDMDNPKLLPALGCYGILYPESPMHRIS